MDYIRTAKKSNMQDGEPNEHFISDEHSVDVINTDEKYPIATIRIGSGKQVAQNIAIDKKGFFYIIQTADTALGVYKIGKTQQADPNKRLCQYPKFSQVKYTIAVEDADGFEDYIMRKFRTIFKRRMEYGLEYYEGDLKKMICVAHETWLRLGHAEVIELDKAVEQIKPNGWQAFANEWLSRNIRGTNDIGAGVGVDIDEAYRAYVKMMRDEFMSNEYAEREIFEVYLTHCLQ